MLTLPDNLTPDSFLRKYWQKRPLHMPRALERLQPSMTRNELAWLATHDDVESSIVFIDRSATSPRYRVESGPFDTGFLQNLPKRDWTLLVHDVEKHIPAMRALLQVVPFIPDWRVDDLMVSFAAPGGGVGPHRDHYDVFLCQGIGIRNWCFTAEHVDDNPHASDDLALLQEFSGDAINASEGDVLYIPPGVAHWGVAERACMTYSIGMRAPQAYDLSFMLECKTHDDEAFYCDPGLMSNEAIPGYISNAAAHRATAMLGLQDERRDEVAKALGQFATRPKEWLKPDGVNADEIDSILRHWRNGAKLELHGMAQVAYDDHNLFLNGEHRSLPAIYKEKLLELCRQREFSGDACEDGDVLRTVAWMLEQGAFEIPEIS
jgi:50S ribosomal protein L16 3-hydroxylase